MYQAMTWDYAAHPARCCGPAPHQEGVAWDSGARFATGHIVGPLRFQLDPLDPSSPNQSPVVPYCFGRRNPLMSADFFVALQACGIDNLEAYPAELREAGDGKPLPGAWVAVNVVGLLSAADLEASTIASRRRGCEVVFDRLVIDADRARGARMFRLAEDPTHVWVDAPLRTQLATAGFPHLRFWRPTQVVSL